MGSCSGFMFFSYKLLVKQPSATGLEIPRFIPHQPKKISTVKEEAYVAATTSDSFCRRCSYNCHFGKRDAELVDHSIFHGPSKKNLVSVKAPGRIGGNKKDLGRLPSVMQKP
jgi:hypothetical protein